MTRLRSKLEKDYFEWMFDLVCGDRYADGYSYSKLLTYLHSIEFTYIISRDADRAEDGIDLRDRYAYEADITRFNKRSLGPCSVLEMMIALAIRCEEQIMDDTAYGDRTAQWFWRMINNLGLGGMTDSRFDDYYVEETIDIFLQRKYYINGQGGLFIVKHTDCNLQHVDIWTQMLWNLDETT